MNEAKLAGITPYVLRLAAYYATMGMGEYFPKGYAWFNRVLVRVLMPWEAKESPTQSALVLIVEFYDGPHRARYVEFMLTPAGFGGDPVMRLLVGDKKDADRDADADQDQPAGDEPTP